MSIDLETIQNRIAQNDELAFKELFEHFFAGLLSYCKSLLRDEPLAEETVEDVFVKLWENRQNLPGIQNISFYLYKAVKYASLDALEKHKRNRSVSLEDVGEAFSFSFSRSESSLISKENCQKISDAVNQLPPKCRLIFRLVKEEGMKYKEVAQLLALSEKTVENQMNIAFKKLIDTLTVTVPELKHYFLSNKNALGKTKTELGFSANIVLLISLFMQRL